MTIIGSAISATAMSVALALTRRHGVVKIHSAKIQTPLLRQATDLFLALGDQVVGFAEKQGVDVNKYIGPTENMKK